MSLKKQKSKVLRHVLATPFDIKWSESSAEGVESVQKALEELLPLARLESTSLKLYSKGERREKIPSSTPSTKRHNNIFRTHLAPGFQSVIRGLEKDSLCCVLMSTEISPPMIQRVVCSYCHTHDVPLMTVPKLKTIARSTLGFSTMVLGFKKSVNTMENKFFPIYEIALQNRSIFQSQFQYCKKNDDLPLLKKEESVIEKRTPEPSINVNDIYLYRGSRKERVFRPGVGVSSQINHQPRHGMDGDFIRFSKGETNSSDFEVVNIMSSDESEDVVSDCDSVDEDNVFVIDNKPDHLLLDTVSSSKEEADSQNDVDMESQTGIKLLKNQDPEKLPKRKAVTTNDRYFSNKSNSAKKIKKKTDDKNILKEKTLILGKTELKPEKKGFTSSKFNPLKIKTIMSNPKKIRRKKK